MVEQAIVAVVLMGWFLLLGAIEMVAPQVRARSQQSTDSRLITNFGLGIATLLLSSALPIARLSSAEFIGSARFSFASHVSANWVGLAAALFIADSFAAYWTHRLMHAVPVFWRIHRVHHADERLDVSTGLRNHPLELIITLPTSVAVVFAIGAPLSAVVVVQTIGSAAALWQHADIRIPPRISRSLNRAFVTPDLHRLHHSKNRAQHDTNYGELLTVWDRLFGTFACSRTDVQIGLDDQTARSDHLLEQMWSPLR